MKDLYTEFTTKLLPQIQQGLTITKDYFLDLFARYIKYLIVTDSIWLCISFIIFIVSIIFLVYSIKWFNEEEKKIEKYESNSFSGVVLLFAILTVVSFIFVCLNTSNLVKDIYIPEVRIMEKINSYMK